MVADDSEPLLAFTFCARFQWGTNPQAVPSDRERKKTPAQGRRRSGIGQVAMSSYGQLAKQTCRAAVVVSAFVQPANHLAKRRMIFFAFDIIYIMRKTDRTEPERFAVWFRL